MHFNTAQSRSAWTEQEDEMLRQAVAKFGDRAWATVANDVPGRSSKSCSDRWRNFLSPDIEHPRKSPFTEWEVAVVVQAQHRYGNNWKAISMLLPGRTNRAVKNLFVGNLKWGARLPEIKNRWLECNMSLEELLEIKPDHAGGPVKIRNGATIPAASGSPSSIRAASTSSAGSAWASDITDQPLSGSPASAGTHHGAERRKRADGTEMHHMALAAGQSPPLNKKRRGAPSPVMPPHHHHLQHGTASYLPTVVPHPGALGPGATGSPMLGMPGHGTGDMAGLVGSMGPPASNHGAPVLANNAGMLMQGHGLPIMDEGSPAFAGQAGGYGRAGNATTPGRNIAGAGIPGLPLLVPGQQHQQMMGHMGWHNGMAAAASGTSGSSSPFAAMAQQPLAGMQQLSPASMQHQQGHMLAPHPGAVVPKTEPVMYEGDCSNMGIYAAQHQQHPWDPMAHLAAQQQQQMHAQQHHQMDLQHQQQMHMQRQQHQNQLQRPGSAGGMHGAIPATGLSALGSPSLDDNILQDMRSNDSNLHMLLEGIFDEEDAMSGDPHLHLVETTETGNGQPLQQQQQQQQHMQQVGAGSHSHLQRSNTSAQQEQHQQLQQYQQQLAGTAPPASQEAVAGGSGSLMRSSTWPNSWPEGAPAPDAAAAGMAVPAAAAPPAASTPASFSHTPSHGPGLPPRPGSAAGSAGMAAYAGPDCQAPPAGWSWGPPSAGHSLPGSGPPSTGGMPQQPQHLQVVCHQLQQENLMLLHRVNTLQNRLNSTGEQLPELGICLPGDQPGVETPAAPASTPAGGCGVACVPTPALAGGGVMNPDAMASQQQMMQHSAMAAGAVAVHSSYPTDDDLSRLPPVATRVGGSAGGAGVGGWATGGLEARGSGLVGLGSGGLGLGSGGSGLGALKDELQVSPDGSFTPGQLLEGCMVDTLIADDL